MMENINELIDKNLKLLYECRDNKMASSHFLDINNKKLTLRSSGHRFDNELVERGLVRENGDFCIFKEFGYKIAKNGGWLKYIENKKVDENQNSEREKNIQELTLKKLKFEQFPARFWWLIIIITAIISILTTLISNKFS
jgi:hypothetical protein